ncbi:MAG: hypothetical protein BalsKO_02040 [Balneolaceae bacterium]
METELKYIELKTGFSDNGPAWISKVETSKSGQTIYFNDMALKRLKTPGIGANHFDIETGEEYWISGIKKNGLDRHWAGSGKVMIDEDIVEEYLNLINRTDLNKTKHIIVSTNKSFDKSRFDSIENQKSEIPDYTHMEYYKWYWDNNRKKLVKE